MITDVFGIFQKANSRASNVARRYFVFYLLFIVAVIIIYYRKITMSPAQITDFERIIFKIAINNTLYLLVVIIMAYLAVKIFFLKNISHLLSQIFYWYNDQKIKTVRRLVLKLISEKRRVDAIYPDYNFKSVSRRVLYQAILEIEIVNIKRLVISITTKTNDDSRLTEVKNYSTQVSRDLSNYQFPTEIIEVYNKVKNRQLRFLLNSLRLIPFLFTINYFKDLLSLSIIYVYASSFIEDLPAIINSINGEWSGIQFKRTNRDGIVKEYTL